MLYTALILWGLKIASEAKDRFGAVVAVGVSGLIFWQAVINLGMVCGLLPVVGITLPLFSYGGSSVLTIMIGIGLLDEHLDPPLSLLVWARRLLENFRARCTGMRSAG